MRNQMYDVAHVVVANLVKQRELGLQNKGTSSSVNDALQLVPERNRFDILERAGIREYDGGVDRDTAERGAVWDHLRNTIDQRNTK